MAVSLEKELHTRYLCNKIFGKIRKLITSYQDGTTFDLANCKLGPDVEKFIWSSSSKYNFINSKDADLDHILQNNHSVINTEYEESWPELDIRNKTVSGIIDLASNLQAGNYKLVVNKSSATDTYMLIYLVMMRPDIAFDLGDCGSIYLNIITNNIDYTNYTQDKYYYSYSGNIVAIAKNERGLFEVPTVGVYSEEQVQRNKNFIPYDFGNTKLMSIDKNGVYVHDAWKPVVSYCASLMKSTEESSQNSSNQLRLKDILQTREE